MPYPHAKLSAPASQKTSDQVASLLTQLTADVLKKKPEFTVLTVDFIARERWYLDSRYLAAHEGNGLFLDLRVTEGTNTKDQKSQWYTQVFAGVEAIVGALITASYIVIHDVAADAWGYQGQTQEFRYIKGKTF